MWKKLGVRWQWSPEQYAEKLKIGGGKERMASLFSEQAFQRVFPVPEREEDRKALLASKSLGIPAEDCVAVEDSRNGLLSADSAGIRVLVTTSWFTTGEDFSEARLVVSALGDPGGERAKVSQNRIGQSIGDYVQLEDVSAVLEKRR